MPDIYISREPEQVDKLIKMLTSRGFQVEAQSQITRNMLDFELPEDEFEWTFFSSPYAVQAFFARIPNTRSKLAALGSGTAKALEGFGEVHFKGSGSDTISIGREFLKLAGGKKVLFPSPEKGLRAVQSLFPPGQIHEVICYQTLADPKRIKTAELYVFSSPSNVHAFAELNDFPETSYYIAFGPSTAKALTHYGVHVGEIIQSYEDDALVQAIFSKFAS